MPEPGGPGQEGEKPELTAEEEEAIGKEQRTYGVIDQNLTQRREQINQAEADKAKRIHDEAYGKMFQDIENKRLERLEQLKRERDQGMPPPYFNEKEK